MRSIFRLAGLLLAGIATTPPSARAQGGTPLWTNFFKGGQAYVVAVDSSDNVFVAGNYDNSSGIDFFETVKYSSAGVPLWTNYFKSENGNISVEAMAVDARGDVFVTGYETATRGGDDEDYATIAYSGAGMPLWTNHYNGPGNGSDYAHAIAVDTDGNVFVSGDAYVDSSGGDVNFDYATIKYSAAGAPLWTNDYRVGLSLGESFASAVDESGNVIVSGVATLKYSGSGVPLWTNASGGGVAVDSSGNVVVIGTIKYSSAGAPLWTNYDEGSSVAVDRSGNVFTSGALEDSSNDWFYVTTKYSSGGAPLWTNLYPLQSYGDAHGIAVDSSGNVFVTGTAGTVAYSGAGGLLWSNSYSADDLLYSRTIVVDNSGNVIVRGRSSTVKFSSSIRPQVYLGFQMANNQLVLNWTNAGFTLQSAPDFTAAFTNIPNATSPFTNPTTAPQQFFRLISN